MRLHRAALAALAVASSQDISGEQTQRIARKNQLFAQGAGATGSKGNKAKRKTARKSTKAARRKGR